MLKVYAQFRVDASDKGIALSYVAPLPDHDSDIETDGHRLTRILVNLVGNALKFTNEGRIEFGYTPEDGHIEFYVADTGIGIPATVQDNVFRMFYQADNSYSRGYGGMGLGLAIAKAYVGMLGGEIWFTSQPGEGTVFMFTIPHEKA
jgi:signal transduction histidine kinase